MNQEKIKEVLSDEEFVKSLLEMETPEEVQEALAEKGVDVTVDEIKKLAELMQKKANGELSDEELEEVAGGALFEAAALFITFAVIGVQTAVRSRW